MDYKTGKDLVDEARARIAEKSAKEIVAMRATDESIRFLDVREPNEWNLGRVKGAIHIPRGNLESRVEALIPRDCRVVVYCAQGNRSTLAADTMRIMGYTSVISMRDGWSGWIDAEGEIED